MGQNSKINSGFLGALGALGAPIRAIKLGPSVVAVLATLGAFGLVAMGVVTYLLSGQPIYAILADTLIGAFVFALVWLLLRFAEENPVVAALGGGQLLQYLESQMGAKNPSIIDAHATPVTGAPRPQSGSTDGK
ncbi:MAG TPA: hypothetical protein VII48_00650 [Rhizomicrobium sp.]